MATPEPVRWGILGTAHIARASFLPALRAVGGRAYAVAGRERPRTEAYARDHGIERAVTGYQALLDDPAVEAVYVALPNSLHAEWAEKALERRKAVLCEKPLGLTPVEVARLVTVAGRAQSPLWEAFVFPFRPHFEQIRRWIGDGSIGRLAVVESTFQFQLSSRDNIRLQPELGGGALYDVGCYPVHLASLLFREPAMRAWAHMDPDPSGVDAEVTGLAEYAHGALRLNAGFVRPYDTFTRIIGSTGSILATNPFHPGAGDLLVLRAAGEVRIVPAGDGLPSFAAALSHINQVVRQETSPRWTAVETASAGAETMGQLRAAAQAH